MAEQSSLAALVEERFGGLLFAGPHEPDSIACVLEARSVLLGVPWTDDPDRLGIVDIRALNDGPWPDNETRTLWMIRLHDALNDWATWPTARQRRFAAAVSYRTMTELLAEMLQLVGLTIEGEGCASAKTLAAAEAAARAAVAAAEAAWAAGRAAVAAGAQTVAQPVSRFLERACTMWIEEAKRSETSR